MNALLVLADGSVFEGQAIGADVAVSSGEVVFHTGLTGYQEVLTDPSYAGQVITFTTPHIGNYGVTQSDNESAKIFARGVIMREVARRRSNWRSQEPLEVFLRARGVGGITGIDTRRLTRLLRDAGSLLGAFGTADLATLQAALATEQGTAGRNLVAQVSTLSPYDVSNTMHAAKPFSVVAYDFGMKQTILRCLSEIADVHVVPLKAGLGAVSVPSKAYSIMAAGRPLLAAIDADSEVARIVQNVGCGRVVAPDEPEAFIAALSSMLENRDAMAEMGAKGRLWVVENASPQAVGEAYHQLLATLSPAESL